MANVVFNPLLPIKSHHAVAECFLEFLTQTDLLILNLLIKWSNREFIRYASKAM
jgi:hypothetical protein